MHADGYKMYEVILQLISMEINGSLHAVECIGYRLIEVGSRDIKVNLCIMVIS